LNSTAKLVYTYEHNSATTKVLPKYLLVASIIEFIGLIRMWISGDVRTSLPTGFLSGSDEIALNEEIFYFGFVFLGIIALTKLHCGLNIHSKVIYRLTIWIHILEVGILVVYPFLRGKLNPEQYPLSFIILILPFWMTFSYHFYLSTEKKNIQ